MTPIDLHFGDLCQQLFNRVFRRLAINPYHSFYQTGSTVHVNLYFETIGLLLSQFCRESLTDPIGCQRAFSASMPPHDFDIEELLGL